MLAEPDAEAPRITTLVSYSAIDSREVGYEVDAAVVYAVVDGWYRIRLADGRYGWVAAEHAGTWFPYATLPIRRLSYLTPGWSQLVWPELGAGLPWRGDVAAGQPGSEQPVTVVASKNLGGTLWFQVKVLATDACSGEPSRVLVSGWIPAYGRGGEPNVWFYSRGC